MNHPRRRLRRPARPAVPPSAARRLQCVCGQGIDVLPEQHGWRGPCTGCRRMFEILFAVDAASGSAIVSLAYLEDAAGDTAAETSTSLDAPAPPAKEGALTHAGLVEEPEPPDEAQFRCGCGAVLAIGRESYDKRVSCPACGGRHLVTLAYEVETGNFTIHTFALSDAATGGTRRAARIS